MDKLKSLLPEQVCKMVQGHHCLNPLLGEDRIRWKMSNDSCFNTKRAYHQISKNKWEVEGKLWKKTWKWNGPQRVRTFLWLLSKDNLLTNKRWLIHGAASDVFTRCNRGSEDSLHSVRDYG